MARKKNPQQEPLQHFFIENFSMKKNQKFFYYKLQKSIRNCFPINGICLTQEDRLLTLLAAEVFRDGGAVTEIRPPPPLTGDLLSSLAVTKKKCLLDEQIFKNENFLLKSTSVKKGCRKIRLCKAHRKILSIF